MKRKIISLLILLYSISASSQGLKLFEVGEYIFLPGMGFGLSQSVAKIGSSPFLSRGDINVLGYRDGFTVNKFNINYVYFGYFNDFSFRKTPGNMNTASKLSSFFLSSCVGNNCDPGTPFIASRGISMETGLAFGKIGSYLSSEDDAIPDLVLGFDVNFYRSNLGSRWTMFQPRIGFGYLGILVLDYSYSLTPNKNPSSNAFGYHFVHLHLRIGNILAILLHEAS